MGGRRAAAGTLVLDLGAVLEAAGVAIHDVVARALLGSTNDNLVRVALWGRDGLRFLFQETPPGKILSEI